MLTRVITIPPSNPRMLSIIGINLVLIITIVQSIPVHQFEPSCSSSCGHHYPSSVPEWTACARGCRFFTLIQILARPQSTECIRKSCSNTCNEAYNGTILRKACLTGCKNSVELSGTVTGGNLHHDHETSQNKQWPHEGTLGLSHSMDLNHKESVIWPFRVLNNLYRQLSDQISTSTEWIKTRSSYTLLFGDTSNGKQVFLLRARPQHSSDVASLSHLASGLVFNGYPSQEQRNFHVITFPSSLQVKSTMVPGKNSAAAAAAGSHSSNTLTAASFADEDGEKRSFIRLVSDAGHNVFKDIRLLLALMLAVIVLSIITFSEGVCLIGMVDKKAAAAAAATGGAEPSQPKSPLPFFILDNNLKAEEARLTEDQLREELIQAGSERPPTYEETVKQPALNISSLLASESKA